MFGMVAMGAAFERRPMTRDCVKVVETVSRLEGVDSAELSPQLAQVVDPDALDALLETDSAQVTFTFTGYRVTLEWNGDVCADLVNDS